MSKEAMKLALEALEMVDRDDNDRDFLSPSQCYQLDEAITALREALAEQPAQQEPVAWLITDEKINSLQVDSIQRLIDRARHAHMIDIKLCINGQDEWYQADWLKHLIHATPAQRKPLSNEARENLMKKAWSEWLTMKDDDHSFAWHFLFARHFSFEVEAAHGIKENT